MLNFLKQFIPVGNLPTKFIDGVFTLRTYKSLQFDGYVDDQRKHERDPEEVRVLERITSSALKKTSDGVGKMRKMVKSLVNLTIFGKRGQVHFSVRNTSYFGLNKEMLTTTGMLSHTAILKSLKEMNSNSDIKEQRLNNFIEAALTNQFYDNSTALIFCFLMKYYKMVIANRMNVHTMRIVIGADILVSWYGLTEDLIFDGFRTYLITKGITGVSCMYRDSLSYMLEIKRYLNDLNQDLVTAINAKTLDPRQVEGLELTLKYWKMYEYNDGHSRSGNCFGDHLDFIHNKFLVPQEVNGISAPMLPIITATKNVIPDKDEVIAMLTNRDGFVDCTGLTEREMSILEWSLQGNTRNTPFLVDQEFTMMQAGNRVVAFNAPGPGGNADNIRETEVLNCLKKLITTHRWHQEFYNAIILLKDWVSQPSTETVESHWWTNLDRGIALPQLGLKRAIFPHLLRGEAVCITREALEMYDNVFMNKRHMFVESALLVAAYSWGEYLLRYNAESTTQLLLLKNSAGNEELNPHERVTAIQSALLATGVPVCNFKGAGTFIIGDMEQQSKNIVKFGHIDIEHLGDYGYHLNGQNVIVNSVVPPGATSLIVGLASSLLQGTPLNAEFAIPPVHMVVVDSRFQRGVYFKDLWAMGVVHRWNGFDLTYRTPVSLNRHKMYAANNVSIALPPVFPPTVRQNAYYVYSNSTEREHCFGDDFQWAQDKITRFTWITSRVEMLDGTNYNSPPVFDYFENVQIPRKMEFVEMQGLDIVTAVVSKFNISERFFYLEKLKAGLPLPSARKPLDLLEEEPIISQEEKNTSEETPVASGSVAQS